MVAVRAKRLCVQTPDVVREWWDRSEENYSQRETALEKFLAPYVRDIIGELTVVDRELRTLSAEALCDRAMTAISGGLRMVNQPIGDAERAVWKYWKAEDVARFLAQACKAKKLGVSHREALICYAHARAKRFKLLDEIDRCDEEVEWMHETGKVFEKTLERKVRPKRWCRPMVHVLRRRQRQVPARSRSQRRLARRRRAGSQVIAARNLKFCLREVDRKTSKPSR